MFLIRFVLVLLTVWSSLSFGRNNDELNFGRRPEDIISDYKDWKEIKFVHGGISFKVPKEFDFGLKGADPAQDRVVFINFDQHGTANLRALGINVYIFPYGPDDPSKHKTKTLSEYVKISTERLNVIESKPLVFNKKKWMLVSYRPRTNPKRLMRVNKLLFHKISSKNSDVKDRFIKIEYSEQNNVDSCPPGNEPPCGPTTEKFYSWPIIEKILESVEYIE